MEIYKPQELIDYEYTDPADPFGDTSKDYPQMMYPVVEDGLCASMVGGGSVLPGAHHGNHKLKKAGPNPEVVKEVKRFTEAFTGLYLPKIQIMAAEIKKANFDKMANGDLLTRYVETDGLTDRLTLI